MGARHVFLATFFPLICFWAGSRNPTTKQAPFLFHLEQHRASGRLEALIIASETIRTTTKD